MEFEVEHDLRARFGGADAVCPDARRASLQQPAFPVAGDNVVAKGFPKFKVEEASSLLNQRQDAAATLNGCVFKGGDSLYPPPFCITL